MRTTLTLEPDVAVLVEEEVHRRHESVKEVVNAALRRGLSPHGPKAKGPPYRITPHKTKLRPGLDRAAMNRLVDDMEDEALLSRRRPR